MISTRVLNKFVVKPVISKESSPESNPEHVKGSYMFENIYGSVFLLAKTNSGKTSVIYEIIKNTCDKNTKICIFCSTVFVDKTYKEIIKLMDKMKINYELFCDMGGKKDNLIKSLINILTGEKDPDEDHNKLEHILGDSDQKEVSQPIDIRTYTFPSPTIQIAQPEVKQVEKKVKKKKKKTKLTPNFLFIFDDLGANLRAQEVSEISKICRHFKAKCVFSSQNLNDLVPSTILQLSYVLVFHGLNKIKLFELYRKLNPECSYDTFEKLYDYSAGEKYNFMYIDMRKNEFRKNFNKLLTIGNE